MKRKRVCGAKTRSGGTCGKPPLAGRTRCKLHGGKSPVGVAAPSYQGKGYSKYFPKEIARVYEQTLHDPELLSTREHIALADSRVHELLANLHDRSPLTKLKEIRALVQVIASEDDDMMRARDCIELNDLLDDAQVVAQNWHDVLETIEAGRRLRDTERKRLVALNQFITAEQAMLFAHAVIEAVKQNVKDPHELRKVANAITALTGSRERTQDA
jgi:hypothetical protein